MIQAKFGLNWPSGFRGEDFWKSLQTDDGRRTPGELNTEYDLDARNLNLKSAQTEHLHTFPFQDFKIFLNWLKLDFFLKAAGRSFHKTAAAYLKLFLP